MNGLSIALFTTVALMVGNLCQALSAGDGDASEGMFADMARQNVGKIHSMLGAIRAAVDKAGNGPHLESVRYRLGLVESSMLEFFSTRNPAVAGLTPTPFSGDPLTNIHTMLDRVSNMFDSISTSLTSINMSAFMYLDEVIFRLENVRQALGLGQGWTTTASLCLSSEHCYSTADIKG